MEVQVSTGDKWKRHIDVSLPAEEFNPRVEKILRSYQKRVQLDGFRKGKAPLHVVNKIYGNAARQQTIEDILPDILRNVCEENQLSPVGPAKLEDINYDPGTGLRFRATVEIEPEVELKKYDGFKFERVIYQVSDEDVEDALNELRERHGWLESVEGGAQPGHLIVADIRTVDAGGVPIIGHHYEDQRFEIRPPNQTGEDDFASQLIGVKPGDIRTVRVVDRSQQEPVETYYRVEVKEVSEKKFPELDDDLAQEVGDFKTLDELRQAVRDNITMQAQQRSRDELHHEMMEEILKNNPLELPEAMVEAYTKAYLESLQTNYEVPNGDELREQAHAHTVRYLKWSYIRDEIALAEGLQVSDDELRSYLTAAASARGEDPQRRINLTMHNEKEREKLREQVLDSKVLAFLERRMNIEERKVPYRDRNKSRIIAA